MAGQEEATFEDKVQRYRAFAHRPPSTSSDATDATETSFACETRVRARSCSPRPQEQVHGPINKPQASPRENRRRGSQPPPYSETSSSPGGSRRMSMPAGVTAAVEQAKRAFRTLGTTGNSSSRRKSSPGGPGRMADVVQAALNHSVLATLDETNNSGPRMSSMGGNGGPNPNGSFRAPSPSPSERRQTSIDDDVTQKAFRAMYEGASYGGSGGSRRTSVSNTSLVDDDGSQRSFMTMDTSQVSYRSETPPMKRSDLNQQTLLEASTKLAPEINPGMNHLFHINEETSKLVPFNSFDELSSFLHTMRQKEGRHAAQAREIMDSVLGSSVKNLVSHVTVGEYLHQLHTSNQLTDVIIDVRGVTFQAHRVVLCCHSKYFNNLFTETNSKKIPFELKIKGVSARAFAAFLDFCYTGEINVFPEIAADLLIVCDHLQVPAMKKRCSQITGTLPLDQAIKFMVNCSITESHKLSHDLFDRVLKNFSDAAKFDEFLAMDVERLCEFIASDDLIVQSELQVFQAAMRWIIHCIEDRVKYAMRIMAHVRFCYMTSDELHTCAETTGLLRGFEKFRELILMACWQISSFNMGRIDPFGFPLPPMRTCFLTSARGGQPKFSTLVPVLMSATLPMQEVTAYETTHVEVTQPTKAGGQPQTSTPVPMLMSATLPMQEVTAYETTHVEVTQPTKAVDILLFGCGLPEYASQTQFVERYDTRDNTWSHFCKLPVARRGHAVAAIKGQIYIVGGCKADATNTDPGATNGLFMLDINSKTADERASMMTARRSHCVATSGGKLYVMGGMDEHKRVMKTVERYDPVKDTWTFVSPMNSPRSGACAASLGGIIIVVGGVGEINGVPSTIHVLNTVEGYNVQTDCWTRHNNLRFPRCYANLVSHMDRLLLIGGATRSFNFRSSVLVSVATIDMYDEEGDVWHPVTDMVIPRHEAGAAIAGDKLYIIGGVSTVADRALQSVECLDCQTMRWQSGVQDLPQATGSVCCAPITSKWQMTYNGSTEPGNGTLL